MATLLLGLTREAWAGYGYAAWVAVWSLITFVTYGLDKLAAKQGKDGRGKSKARRVPEKVLHLLALLGGFGGGWLGRQVFRHKSAKPVFALVLGLATALHLSALLGLLWLFGRLT